MNDKKHIAEFSLMARCGREAVSLLCDVFNLADEVHVVDLGERRPYQDILHPESTPVQLTNLELAPRAAHCLLRKWMSRTKFIVKDYADL